MNIKEIFMRGVDYRTPEREAPDGLCREINNLHPAGPKESPVWRPGKAAVAYYSHAGGWINGFHVWHRSNQQSALVYLHWSSDTNAAPSTIQYVLLDSEGNITGSPVELWAFPVEGRDAATDVQRKAIFAQVGDNLAIAVTPVGGTPEVYTVTHHDNVPLCFPLNVPFRATGFTVDTSQASSLPEVEGKATFTGWVGLRTALELYDGTFIRPSGVYLGGAVTYKQRKIVITMPQLEIQTSGIDWRKIVRGVAFFLADSAENGTNVYRDSIFRHVGTMAKVFDEEETLTVDIYADDLPTKTPLHEDIISTHDILAGGVFSYNKNLLLTDVRYRLLPPENPEGTRDDIAEPVGSNPLRLTSLNALIHTGTLEEYVPQTLTGDGRSPMSWSFYHKLTWVNPTLAQTILPIKKIQIQFKYKYQLTSSGYPYPNPFSPSTITVESQWITLLDNDSFSAETFQTGLPGQPEYAGGNWYHTGESVLQVGDTAHDLIPYYRVRAVYADGKTSQWTQTPPVTEQDQPESER